MVAKNESGAGSDDENDIEGEDRAWKWVFAVEGWVGGGGEEVEEINYG